MLRSILAVIAGFAVISVLIGVATVLAARLMLGAVGREQMMQMKPTPAFTTVNLFYSALFAVVGGFLTALIADHAPLHHALGLAALMFVLSIFSMVQPQRVHPGQWYGFALMIIGPAGAGLGGWLEFWRRGP